MRTSACARSKYWPQPKTEEEGEHKKKTMISESKAKGNSLFKTDTKMKAKFFQMPKLKKHTFSNSM